MDTRQLAEQIIQFGGGEEPGIKNAKGEPRRVKPATKNMGAFLLSSETQDVSTLNSVTSLKSAREGLSTQRESAFNSLSTVSVMALPQQTAWGGSTTSIAKQRN
jgi:hypothetical protein